MTLGGPSTRPRPGSQEEALIRALRSGGYAMRYNEDDAVHRIMEPSPRGNTAVGLIVIRDQRIVYAEFDRVVYPWWGRTADSPEYAQSFAKLDTAVAEGRRK